MNPVIRLAIGLLLTMSAGFTDAIGFVELGGYFTSFMSGNSTQLAFGLANHLAGTIALPASLVGFFFAGGFVGSLLSLRAVSWAASTTLLFVCLLLALALLLDSLGVPAHFSLLFLAASAGAQNAVIRPSGSARLGTTYVTGTLFMASQELAQAIYGKAPARQWLLHLLIWLALLLGAFIGATMHLRFGTIALLLPLALYLLLLARALLRRGKPD
ncbi:DUF1275 family protein [Devosia sp.]|uniref:YoaK family protein n=1 Tax=Devosia sp. TaxID=1871048 RepID=UPI0032674DE6